MSPEIATARALTDRKLYIQAKNIGTTNVAVYDDNMRAIRVLDVEVALDTANLQAKIRAAVGSNGIHVSNDNGRIVLSGPVNDALSADRAYNLAKAWVTGVGARPAGSQATGGPQSAVGAKSPLVINLMTVASPQQVMLKVRFLEVDRNAARALGINWSILNGSGKGATRDKGASTR